VLDQAHAAGRGDRRAAVRGGVDDRHRRPAAGVGGELLGEGALRGQRQAHRGALAGDRRRHLLHPGPGHRHRALAGSLQQQAAVAARLVAGDFGERDPARGRGSRRRRRLRGRGRGRARRGRGRAAGGVARAGAVGAAAARRAATGPTSRRFAAGVFAATARPFGRDDDFAFHFGPHAGLALDPQGHREGAFFGERVGDRFAFHFFFVVAEFPFGFGVADVLRFDAEVDFFAGGRGGGDVQPVQFRGDRVVEERFDFAFPSPGADREARGGRAQRVFDRAFLRQRVARAPVAFVVHGGEFHLRFAIEVLVPGRQAAAVRADRHLRFEGGVGAGVVERHLRGRFPGAARGAGRHEDVGGGGGAGVGGDRVAGRIDRDLRRRGAVGGEGFRRRPRAFGRQFGRVDFVDVAAVAELVDQRRVACFVEGEGRFLDPAPFARGDERATEFTGGGAVGGDDPFDVRVDDAVPDHQGVAFGVELDGRFAGEFRFVADRRRGGPSFALGPFGDFDLVGVLLRPGGDRGPFRADRDARRDRAFVFFGQLGSGSPGAGDGGKGRRFDHHVVVFGRATPDRDRFTVGTDRHAGHEGGREFEAGRAAHFFDEAGRRDRRRRTPFAAAGTGRGDDPPGFRGGFLDPDGDRVAGIVDRGGLVAG
jgi:hypothetical protein